MGWRWVLQRTVMDWMPDKSSLLAFHISPVHSRFNIGISSAMTFGFNLMPLSNLEKDTVLSMFEKYRPTAFETHPNHFVRLANVVKETPAAFASIRYLHSTFDAINKDTMHTFLAASKRGKSCFLTNLRSVRMWPNDLEKTSSEHFTCYKCTRNGNRYAWSLPSACN